MNAVVDVKPPLGLIHGLSNEAYHASLGISNSGLVLIGKSPRHYFGRYLDPLRPPPEPKPGQLEGTMFHAALFEPAEYPLRYVAGPNVRRGTKVWDAFEAGLKPGQTAVKPDEFEQARAMARSMRSLQDVREILSKGHPEVSAYAEFEITDDDGEITKVLVRVRPDWVFPVDDDSVILFDGKSCGDASNTEFARQIARKWYHHQAAFYIDVYQKASGKTVREFVFGQCETEWPYVGNTCALYPEDIEKGRELYRRNLQTYVRCLKSGEWPGYGETVQLISLPSWTKGGKS